MTNTNTFIFQSIGEEENGDFPLSAPLGKNSVSSLAVLFEDRKYYSEVIVPAINNRLNTKAIFCDLLGKNALFGLVDTALNAVEYDEENLSLKEIPSGDEEPKLVMDFVADAFNEMNNYLKTAALLGKISKSSVFYNLKAYSAYYSLKDAVKFIEDKYTKEFKNYINKNLDKSSRIIDAQTFNKVFIDFLKNNLKGGLPLTKTGILFSLKMSKRVNALTIDIAKDKSDNDNIKFKKYFLDNDFPVFADACKRFGFLIDLNVPWRIIPDFSSPAMNQATGNHIGYLTRYDLNSYSDLIDIRYRPIRDTEIIHLKQTFYNIYNSFIADNPYFKRDLKDITCHDENPFYRRKEISFDKYVEILPESYWTRLYVYLRNIEDERGFQQQEFENIVREANNYVNVGRTQEAMVFINNYFKEFKNIYYFSSLRTNKSDVQQAVQSKMVSDLIF